MGLSKCCRARWIEVVSSSFRAGGWLFMIESAMPGGGGHMPRPNPGAITRSLLVRGQHHARIPSYYSPHRPDAHRSFALATAAEARVLTVGSTQVAAKAIAAVFEKQTRNPVTFTIRPPFDIDKALADKTFDAIILSLPA